MDFWIEFLDFPALAKLQYNDSKHIFRNIIANLCVELPYERLSGLNFIEPILAETTINLSVNIPLTALMNILLFDAFTHCISYLYCQHNIFFTLYEIVRFCRILFSSLKTKIILRIADPRNPSFHINDNHWIVVHDALR